MSQVIARQAQPGQVTHLCRAVGLSRSSYYRHRRAPQPVDRDRPVRDRIAQLALDWPRYGYRRITAQLHRDGLNVNHKRVLRLMRLDNLLCQRKRRFVRTTDSSHDSPVYPNLVPTLDVTGTDQLWVADLTYVRLPQDFVYLAVILDAHSRRCIGWSLGRSLDASLTLDALVQALSERHVSSALVHHSDRGVQYASQEYTQLLKDHGIRISMSRRGNPYDNAFAESFMKTLKHEEVYLNDYQTLSEARACIGHFIDDVYNHKRLHSALGYLPPAEFEQSLSHVTQP